MVRISIIAHTAAYGNAAVLAKGMESFANVTTSFFCPDVKIMYPSVINNKISEADHYIIVGAISIMHFPPKYYNKSVTVILTDSTYFNNYKSYNNIIKSRGWKVWAMPDLAERAETNNIYYQPFIISSNEASKTELICHSPYCESKMKEKGTDLIKTACARNNLPLNIITNKTWDETIKIKASHRIFVDQIYRGLGKSGLEAMLVGCVVLSGIKPNCDYLPPVKWTNETMLEEDLISVVSDINESNRLAKVQKQWAIENINPKFVAKRIFEKL